MITPHLVPEEDAMKHYENHVNQAISAIDRAKRNLAEQIVSVENYMNADNIAASANRIAAQEGELHVLQILARAQQNGASSEAMERVLFREALRGPDDTWSGRNNDVRRSYADGIRKAIDDALWDLKD